MAATREINYSDTLSKLALMVQGMAISLCIAKTLRFSGGIVAHLLKYHQSDLLTRLRFAWYPMVHRLNRQINAEFKKAGITISFPQRDVHLDASSPLEIRVVSDQVGPKTT